MGTKIVSFGAGTVGTSWAISFLRGGYNVTVYDIDDSLSSTLKQTVKKQLGVFRDTVDADSLCSQLSFTSDLEEAVNGAVYAQESIVEDQKIKRSFYEDLDKYASPGLIIASSTSGIPGSAFMLDLGISPRCLVAHPTNPPHLIPLVEVCPTVQTDPIVVKRTESLLKEIGQHPVRIHKEIDGFVLNRLQSALLAEAMSLVSAGYVEPADLDCVIKFGLGLRWAFMGPFETAHLNAIGGFADYMSKFRDDFQHEFESVGNKVKISDQLVDTIATELCEQIPLSHIPEAQLWRDRRIVALRRHLTEAEPWG